MTIKSLFEKDTLDEISGRIHHLNPESTAVWGKMSVDQMLAHCAEVQDVMNGKELKNTPFVVKVFKNFIKKIVLGTKPYKRGVTTHAQYRMTSKKDFEKEKERLMLEIKKFHESTEDVVHPLFGKMTRDERGWASYKHLDHHLTQFGV